MKIAVISDTHDQIWRLQKILPELNKADILLHCGDLCSPFMVHALGNGLRIPVHIVLGNNDGDALALKSAVDMYEHMFLYGRLASIQIEGLQTAMTHYPDTARALAAAGEYDLVVYGHDHTAFYKRAGKCMLLNPGEFLGLNGTSSYAVLDSDTLEITMIEEEMPRKV